MAEKGYNLFWESKRLGACHSGSPGFWGGTRGFAVWTDGYFVRPLSAVARSGGEGGQWGWILDPWEDNRLRRGAKLHRRIRAGPARSGARRPQRGPECELDPRDCGAPSEAQGHRAVVELGGGGS